MTDSIEKASKPKKCEVCKGEMVRLEKPWDVIDGWVCWNCLRVWDDEGKEY